MSDVGSRRRQGLAAFGILLVAGLVFGQTRPIREVRQNDDQGVPLLNGQTVTVTGRVTEAGHFGYYGPAFVQDASGGVMLNGPNVSSGIGIGDSVLVAGTVSQYAGRTQLENLNVTRIGAGPIPVPIEFRLDWVDDIDTAAGYVENEGWFVTFDSVQIAHVPGERFAAKTYTITDAYGGSSLLYIDADVLDLMGREIPDGWVSLTGLISQHTFNQPYFTGYQVMPRMAADLGVPVAFESIRDAIRDDNGDGFPDRWGQSVTVTGIVTVPTRVFDPVRLDIYIQDTTAGVNVFDWSISEAFDVGDSVMVTGKVDWYRGKTELTSPAVTVLARNVGEPAPRVLSCADINNEPYEGELVKLVGVTTTAYLLEGNKSYDVQDGTGTATMRIDGDTDIPGLALSAAPFTLVGIKTQYTDSARPLQGYQIQPRFRTDFLADSETLPLRTIAEVQRPGADGVTPLLRDSIVRVRGRVTGPASSFTVGTNKSLYVQDHTQGVNVYGCRAPDGQAKFLDSLGVEWEVIGTVLEYNGLTEIANGTMWVTDSAAQPVTPRLLPYNVPLTEAMESNLITVVGDVVKGAIRSGSGYNVEIKNGTPGITVRIGDLAGVIISDFLRYPGRRVRFTGIVGQYDYDEPYTSGYQLLPRFNSDVSDTSGAFPPAEELLVYTIEPSPFAPHLGEVAAIQINAPTGYRLTVTLFDMQGRTVRELLREGPGGYYDLKWDGTDNLSKPQPAGIYLVSLKGVKPGGGVETIVKPLVIAARF